MTRSLAQSNDGLKNVPVFLLEQLVMASPVLIGVWLSGLVFLWRSGNPLWRSLVWSYGLLIVFFAFTAGAKPYYVAGTYIFLIAAGAVNLERRWSENEGRLRGLFIGVAVSTVFIALITLPVLPASIGGKFSVDPTSAESIGWPELVHTVAGVWHRLTPEQRADAVIYTGNYGEAGAINELGRDDGLPTAVSGHNSEWFWGPGNPHATTVVAVIQKRPEQGAEEGVRELHRDFAHVRVAATLNNGHGITDQEQGGHVYICTDPVRTWGQLWPSLKHYD